MFEKFFFHSNNCLIFCTFANAFYGVRILIIILETRDLHIDEQRISWKETVRLLQNTSFDRLKALCCRLSEPYENAEDASCSYVLDSRYLNDQRYLNRHLIFVNHKMKVGGIYICGFFSSEVRNERLHQRYGKIYPLVHFLDFLWHRACPKLIFTRHVYFTIYRQVKRVYPQPEVLGRLCYCGFDILHIERIGNAVCVVCQKVKEPSTDEHPSYDLFIRLKRVGKNGRRFSVYKLRTMYAYSEYLQKYVYEHNSLDSSGKFANDFRVSGWGRRMRKYWLDELPMLLNVLKGDMKLVGVRPLSEHYYSLYTPEMQAYRIKTKPGMFPPYYVDMPESLEEVQASEKKYLDAFFAHPVRTQWTYFWKIMSSIFIKRRRSK